MTPPRKELISILCISVLQVMSTYFAEAQFGEKCLTTFTQGKANFVVDANESVNEGATFIFSPQVTKTKDCIVSCCKDRHCNVALMENGDVDGTIKSCYLFNCLYKQKKVCRFVRKEGFNNYLLTSVLGKFPEEDGEDKADDDKPPIANPGQDKVVQPQEMLTLTGLQSQDDQKIVNYQWTLISGNPAAIIEAGSYPDEVRVSNLSAGVYKFQLTVTDSIGQTNSAQITVLVLTPEQSNHHCLVPKKVGPCRGRFPRWHYNAVTEKCEEFVFGGCNPNRNNYLSEAECQTACDGISVMPGGTGRRVTVPIPAVEKCGEPCQADQFTCANECCLDAGLLCDGETQCSDGSDEGSCLEMDKNFRRLIEIPVDENKVRCTEPPKTGPCRASFTNWFYDPYDLTCSRFNYGGCQGNDNRFETLELCLKACQGVTSKDVFARKGEFEYQESDKSTVPVIIAILLGVAIIILVVVLFYCLLKKKKDQQPRQQRAGVNGVHATLEDTEKLVYNSTTKPI